MGTTHQTDVFYVAFYYVELQSGEKHWGLGKFPVQETGLKVGGGEGGERRRQLQADTPIMNAVLSAT